MVVHAYAAYKPGDLLQPFSYEEAPLGPHDVEIKISHCGICFSDIHMIDNNWGSSRYPLVPGHEIIGTVLEKGSEVHLLEKGSRVGIGWQRSACLNCTACKTGEDNFCPTRKATIIGHHGGYADKIRFDSRFVFPIPEALPSAGAASLLCAGATVYSPFRLFDVRPAMRVGIIGIGGLGHLAIQFASAMGCEVVAFSHSKGKEAEAKALGANEFLLTSSSDALKEAAHSFDFILATLDGDTDWTPLLALLGVRGRFCFVGAPKKPVSVSVEPLIHGGRSVSGSAIGSRAAVEEMLQFAARHNIKAQTEIMPMSAVNEAIARVREGKVHYRMVLANE